MTKIDEIKKAIRVAYVENVKYVEISYVPLTWIRECVSQYQRGDVDRALTEMGEDGDAILIPESNQKTLTDLDRRAALRFGGQDKHLIHIG